MTVKTARFKAVVQKCGAPRIVTLWSNPEKDRDFLSAVKSGRVMTLIRENVGSRKAFGLIGFEKRPGASYLVFPGSLNEFADRRIVGINYDLIREPDVTDPIQKVPRHKPFKSQSVARGRSTAEKDFSVCIRCEATVELETFVQALSKTVAREKALAGAQPDWNKATVKKAVVAIEGKKNSGAPLKHRY